MSHIYRPLVVHIAILRFCALVVGSLCITAIVPFNADAQTKFALVDGTVTYADDAGQPRSFDVGVKCADLWVSSDAAFIAFVAMDKVREVEDSVLGDKKFVVEQSSIYVARRSNHFMPVRVVSRSFLIDGRSWGVLRNPSISPDGDSLYFTIPYAMTTQRAMRLSLASGRYEDLGDTTKYCVVWGGPHSGALLMQRRHPPEVLSEGVTYRCYLRNASGDVVEVSDECSLTRTFADSWAAAHRGVCRIVGE